jgi:CDP-diglyceride synthetase
MTTLDLGFLLGTTLQRTTAPEITVWGVLIPAVVFALAFTVTWMLYNHFRKATGDGGDQSRGSD